MGEDLSKAAGRGVDVDIDGATWTLSPLTMGDLADFQAHVRSQRLRTLKENLDGLTEDLKRDLILGVINTPVDGDEMDREMSSFAGFRFLLWKSLSKKHAELTAEKVGQMINTQNIQTLLPVIQAISGMEDEDRPPVEGAQPGTPSPGGTATPS